MLETPRELQQKNIGTESPGATRMNVPETGKDVRCVRLAIMQLDLQWKAMVSALGALLEICPKDVKEQMMMMLDKICEIDENLKAKVVSYTTNKSEQARGGQKDDGRGPHQWQRVRR